MRIITKLSLKIISTTVEYKGNPIKIEKGKIYLQAFGTTPYNRMMHLSWMEVPLANLKRDVREFLEENNLI
jgi:hypothetical protein